MARATARPLYSSSIPQVVPLSIPGARQLEWSLRLPPLEPVRTRPPQRRWLRKPNLLRLNHLGRMTRRLRVHSRATGTDDDMTMTTVDFGLTETVQHQVSQSAGPQNAAPVQFFTPFWCSCRHPHRSSHMVIPAPFHMRVFRSYSRVDVVIRGWIRWTPNRTWRH